MTASEVRAEARKKLANKWGKAAVIFLVYGIITYIISFLIKLVPAIGPIAATLIEVPLSYGLIISMVKLNDDEEVGNLDFLSNGFSNFTKSWSVTLWIFVKLIIPVILVVIPAFITIYGVTSSNTAIIVIGVILYVIALIALIIKSLSYSLSIFIAIDNSDMTGKEAVEKSAELMKGKVGAYFCLDLSFIGWAILCIFTLGIGILWLMPYQKIAELNFYRNLIGENRTAE